MSDEEMRDPLDDQDLDQRLDSLSEGLTLPEDFRRSLKLQLRGEVVRRHRRRGLSRPATLTLSLTVLIVALNTQGTLIGHHFDLKKEALRYVEDADRYYSEYGDFSIAVPNDQASTRDHQHFAEALHGESASGTGELVSIEGFTFLGRTELTRSDRYIIDGDSVLVEAPLNEQPKEYLLKKLDFVIDWYDLVVSEAESGELEELPMEIREYPDAAVRFRKWFRNVPGWGDVIYWYGEPIDDTGRS